MKLLTLFVILATIAVVPAQTRKPLTASDLIEMKQAGLDEQTIIKAIESNGAAIDTSAQELVTLKKAGLGDAVIQAALNAATTARAASSKGQANDKSEQGARASHGTITLPARTPVRLTLDETLSSGTAKPGQTYRLTVTEDVAINGRTVIAKGAPASGRISTAKKKSFATSNGQLEIVVDSAQAVNGQNIALEGRVTEGGGGVGFARFGSDAKIEKGYIITAVTDAEILLKLN